MRVKKIFVILTTIVILGVITYSIYQRGCMIPKEWLSFESRNKAFDFTFKYPPDWKPQETKGRTEEYDQANMFGPRDKERKFTLAYGITVQSVGEESAADLLNQYVKYLANASQFKMISKKNVKIGGRSFPGVRIQYLLRLPIYQINAKDVLMEEETYVIINGKHSYRMNLLGTKEQVRKYYPVFKGMLKTFRFKNQ